MRYFKRASHIQKDNNRKQGKLNFFPVKTKTPLRRCTKVMHSFDLKTTTKK